MGCAVGTTTEHRLRNVIQEVSDLRRRLDDSEREKLKLRSQLEGVQKQEFGFQLEAVQKHADIQKPTDQSEIAVVTGAQEAEARIEPDDSPPVAASANHSSSPQELAVQENSDAAADAHQDGSSALQVAESIMTADPVPVEAEVGQSPDQPAVLLPGVVNADNTEAAAIAAEVPHPTETVEASAPVAAATTEDTAQVEDAQHAAVDTEGCNAAGDGGSSGASIATVIEHTTQCQPYADVPEPRSAGTSIATVLEDTRQCQANAGSLEVPPLNVEDRAGEAAVDNDKAILDSGKVPNSMDSEASTCTQAAPAAPSPSCDQCGAEGVELFLDQTDQRRYCTNCWIEYYGSSPNCGEILPLVPVEVVEMWPEDRLMQAWNGLPIPGWPPFQIHSPVWDPLSETDEVWSDVAVRLRRDVVGPHARQQTGNVDRPRPNELLKNRYRCKTCVGEGHFTKAFLAEDLTEGVSVCVKRHRNLSVEQLADLMVLCRRLNEVDAGAVVFPRLIDAFFDISGFTVESLLDGCNCLSMARTHPDFFRNLANLQHVALGGMQGLAMLEKAGVVHNDMKPDNLMWVEVPVPTQDGSLQERRPQVRIVDFGCARLDHRQEPGGRNWALNEGGAGHLGKWSPEMILRLPISHKSDVWGLVVALCELHCGRFVWRNEQDTAEVVFAQAIGLCNLREGIPTSMLKRSPVDIRQLYTPQPRHFPVRRNVMGHMETLHPVRWGLEQVLGENWRKRGKAELGELLQAGFIVDPMCRPSAADLLQSSSFVASPQDSEARSPIPEDVKENAEQSPQPPPEVADLAPDLS